MKKAKYVYFLSNNKKPNLKFFFNSEKEIPLFSSRSAARAAKASATGKVKIFQVSCTSVR